MVRLSLSGHVWRSQLPPLYGAGVLLLVATSKLTTSAGNTTSLQPAHSSHTSCRVGFQRGKENSVLLSESRATSLGMPTKR